MVRRSLLVGRACFAGRPFSSSGTPRLRRAFVSRQMPLRASARPPPPLVPCWLGLLDMLLSMMTDRGGHAGHNRVQPVRDPCSVCSYISTDNCRARYQNAGIAQGQLGTPQTPISRFGSFGGNCIGSKYCTHCWSGFGQEPSGNLQNGVQQLVEPCVQPIPTKSESSHIKPASQVLLKSQMSFA